MNGLLKTMLPESKIDELLAIGKINPLARPNVLLRQEKRLQKLLLFTKDCSVKLSVSKKQSTLTMEGFSGEVS